MESDKSRCAQGSLLGPLLFNFYVNYLSYFVCNTSCLGSLSNGLAADLSVLSSWFESNYLNINAAKTQAVAIWPSLYEYEFNLNDRTLETQDTLKILEVILDSKLNFKAHIEEQLRKACTKTSPLRRLRKFNS